MPSGSGQVRSLSYKVMGRGKRAATVLLLDDAPAIRLLLRRTLEPQGLRVLEAADANTAWGLIAVERPALLILEMRLYGADPLELCRALRRDRRTAAMRVLVLTTVTAEHELDRALEAGVDAVMTKPFRPLQLLATVDHLLEGRRAGARRASSGRSPS